MFGPHKGQDWKTIQFTEFASVDVNMTTDFETYANVPHIGIDSIQQKSGELSGYRTVAEDNVKSGKYIFTPNHIIYSKIRPNLNKVAEPNFKGLCSADAYPILANENICRKSFLVRLLRSDIFLEYIIPLSNRTGMPKVNREQVEGFSYAMPPTELQDKFLAIAQQADKSKFDGFKSQFIEMFGKHSEVVKLKDIVNIMDDKRKPINEGERSSMKEGNLYPYYGATGVVDFINAYLTDERLLCIAEDCGNYGPGEESSYIIEGKAWVNNHAHVVKPNDELCDITYLHNFLKVTDLLPFVSGTTRKKLTQKAMNNLDIILPPINKQREYVSICDHADKSKSINFS